MHYISYSVLYAIIYILGHKHVKYKFADFPQFPLQMPSTIGQSAEFPVKCLI